MGLCRLSLAESAIDMRNARAVHELDLFCNVPGDNGYTAIGMRGKVCPVVVPSALWKNLAHDGPANVAVRRIIPKQRSVARDQRRIRIRSTGPGCS